jgi:hypothetical protein
MLTRRGGKSWDWRVASAIYTDIQPGWRGTRGGWQVDPELWVASGERRVETGLVWRDPELDVGAHCHCLNSFVQSNIAGHVHSFMQSNAPKEGMLCAAR